MGNIYGLESDILLNNLYERREYTVPFYNYLRFCINLMHLKIFRGRANLKLPNQNKLKPNY